MSRVKHEGTVPEMRVRRLLHSLGYRYHCNDRALPGAPDVVFKRRRCVVFVHGCFWHRHSGCRKSTVPKANRSFWQAKFESNVARDNRVQAELKASGWRVIVIWECETLDEANLAKKLRGSLGPTRWPGR